MSDTRTTDLPDLDYVLDKDPPHEATVHGYPRDPRYRRSGMHPPQPGDIARCGHVKKNPQKPGEFDGVPVSCPRCRVLKGLAA